MPRNREIIALKGKIAEDEMKNQKEIAALNLIIEENKKEHESLIEALKAQHEANLKSLRDSMEKEYNMDKDAASAEILELEIESGKYIYQLNNVSEVSKENECLKKEVEALKSNMKEATDKLKHIHNELDDKIECPVCMETPREGPVYACPNGHLVCKECRSESCPTCRVSMGNGKSLLAVTVIENIEHLCKFVDCGELFANDKVDEHEKICKHRTVSCPYDLCNEKISLSKLLEHLGKQTCCSTSVPTVITNSSKSGKAHYRITSDLAIAGGELYWIVNYFSFQDVNFAVVPVKLDNLFYFTMVMFESEKECSNYNIEMEVHERDSTSQDSEFSFKFRGKPTSIDEDRTERKYQGLTVNNKGMEKIISKSKEMVFSISFSFNKK
eukprot:GFUD01024210.1.p1 GENE.GFUD01024210.1~~GFUD01024210.1.p1  ORF type:complete len:385 (+),score=80.51 GFUD01024210.1:46-1200(+)